VFLYVLTKRFFKLTPRIIVLLLFCIICSFDYDINFPLIPVSFS